MKVETRIISHDQYWEFKRKYGKSYRNLIDIGTVFSRCPSCGQYGKTRRNGEYVCRNCPEIISWEYGQNYYIVERLIDN